MLIGLAGSLGDARGRVLLGFGEGATFPVATRAMADWTPAARRGFAQGITHAFGAARQRADAAARRLADRARRAGAARSSILGVISLIWAVAWAIYFRDNPPRSAGITREEIERLPRYRTREDASASRCRGAALTRADAAGHRRLLLLRLDAVALPVVDSAVLPSELQAEAEQFGASSPPGCSSAAWSATRSAASSAIGFTSDRRSQQGAPQPRRARLHRLARLPCCRSCSCTT